MPSDTLSTHNLVASGMVMLRRWGLLDRLTATGCPAAAHTRVTLGESTFEVPIEPLAGVDATVAPRRSVIDPLLVDAAGEAGVDVRLGTTVTELLWHKGRVVGVCGHDAAGRQFEANAHIVVGADGTHSFVARAAGAKTYREGESDNCVYFAYWHGVPEPHTLEVALTPGRAMAIFPTHDGNACVLAARPASEWAVYRRNPESEYLAILAAVPGFRRRVLCGQRVSRFFGTADLPNFFRDASGPGWVLVGDAGFVKDPGPGRGMSDAFRQADRLAAAIDDGLRGRVELDLALATFGTWRDSVFAGVYATTVDLARYDWTIEEVSLRFLRHQEAIAAEHEVIADEEAAATKA
jgi:flavin-dependent dehydrogenase